MLSNEVNKEFFKKYEGLFPSLGYFGDTKDTALKFPILQRVESVLISINTDVPESIDLNKIYFTNDINLTIPSDQVIKSASISSNIKDSLNEELIMSLRLGNRVKTKVQLKPLLMLNFHDNHPLCNLNIINNLNHGLNGCKSKWLDVEIRRKNGNSVVFNNINQSKTDKILNDLLKEIKYEYSPDVFENESIKIKDKLKSKILSHPISLSKSVILQMLPFWKPKNISDMDYLLMADYVLRICGSSGFCKTKKLTEFSKLLSSDVRIFLLEKNINMLIKSRNSNFNKVRISPTFINCLDNTEIKTSQILEIYFSISSILQSQKYKIIISKIESLKNFDMSKFFNNDKNIDSFILIKAYDQLVLEIEIDKIIKILASNKIYSKVNDYGHIEIYAKQRNINLIPVIVDNKNAVFINKKNITQSLNIELFFPLNVVKSSKYELEIPSNPKQIIQYLYGEAKNIWPWPITKFHLGDYKNESQNNNYLHKIKRSKGNLNFVGWGQHVFNIDKKPAPKNSLYIIKYAAESKYDSVELDVRITKDKVPILAHDPILKYNEKNIAVEKSFYIDTKKFCIGNVDGKNVFVPTLKESLELALQKNLDVQIDFRGKKSHINLIKKAVNDAKFPEYRLQFCISQVEVDPSFAKKFLTLFPSSVLMRKTYQSAESIDKSFLIETKLMKLDGVMMRFSSKRNFDYTRFIERIHLEGLRILLFIFRGTNKELSEISKTNVDYITTFKSNLPIFKFIQKKK